MRMGGAFAFRVTETNAYKAKKTYLKTEWGFDRCEVEMRGAYRRLYLRRTWRFLCNNSPLRSREIRIPTA